MPYTLVHNGTLIDGSGRAPVPDAALLLDGKVIKDVGRLADLRQPEGEITTLDAQGGWILPGFIDAHVHIMAHAQAAGGIKNAVLAGIYSIEHGIFIDEECMELMLARGTWLVPTLIAPVAVVEAANTQNVPEWGLRKAREVIDIHRENIAKAYRAGVKIALGTDSAVGPARQQSARAGPAVQYRHEPDGSDRRRHAARRRVSGLAGPPGHAGAGQTGGRGDQPLRPAGRHRFAGGRRQHRDGV
jgi:imidazolonepropionase-like amidohydrolase